MNDPYFLNGEHPADRVLQQVPGVPPQHVAKVFHGLGDELDRQSPPSSGASASSSPVPATGQTPP